SVLPETDVCFSVIRSCREHVPALRIGSASGWARGSAAMSQEITCTCALCEMEPRLLASLAVADEPVSAFGESSLPLAYPSVPDLVRLLRAAPAHAESDAMLGEILKARAARDRKSTRLNSSHLG